MNFSQLTTTFEDEQKREVNLIKAILNDSNQIPRLTNMKACHTLRVIRRFIYTWTDIKENYDGYTKHSR